MSSTCTILGGAVLALLLAGYLGQRFLPPPKPKIVGIDLGTTYSCIGVYHAVSGDVSIFEDDDGHKCIPSIVAFSEDGVVVGYDAATQADLNAENTLYDGKRFIGKPFSPQELSQESTRYSFKLVMNKDGMVHYVVNQMSGTSDGQQTAEKQLTEVLPEEVGAHILRTLKETAEKTLGAPVKMAVMSVPAEFNQLQRNYTSRAAKLAGLEVLRLISEPTAAALAYGLHKKSGVHNVMVVDLGGGTLDVSLLAVQGGMFLTQAMAGNNHLGGQDFNQRLLEYVLTQISTQFTQNGHINLQLNSPDLQHVRDAVEAAKLQLSNNTYSIIDLSLTTVPGNMKVKLNITREKFQSIASDLFQKVLEPIKVVLEDVELAPRDIEEVVLVGGSTRIPRVRELIGEYFGKKPNTAIDPEVAVTTGVSIQAGILGGVWPLTVSAVELPTHARKIHIQ